MSATITNRYKLKRFRCVRSRATLLLVAALLVSVAGFAQSPLKLWENKWDVNFFVTRQSGFSSDSKYYALGGQDGTVRIFTAATGDVYDLYHIHRKEVFSCLFQPGGTLIASGDKDGVLAIYDYASKTEKFVISAHNGAITAIAFSTDGHLLITGSKDHSIGIWDPATGKLISRIENITGSILAVRITPQNKTLVVGTTALSKGLRIFDVQSGEQLAALESANVQNLDLSPNGEFIATANLEKTLTIWSLFEYREAFVIQGHKRHVNDVSFDPAGRYLASSSDDHSVIIWDLHQHKRAATITGEKAMAGIAYSPDGRFLATLDNNGALCMWDVSKLAVIPENIEQIDRLRLAALRHMQILIVIEERAIVPVKLPSLPALKYE